MNELNPLNALLGGAMIGSAAVGLLYLLGRIAGISGILAGALRPSSEDWTWRIAFLAGLPIGAVVTNLALRAGGHPATQVIVEASLPMVLAGGLLVGFGTRLGNGCTSGHGICGMARLSKRSIVATLMFMGTAMATVFVVRHLFGLGVAS